MEDTEAVRSGKRKRSTVQNKITTEMKTLFSIWRAINWDNTLRGKLAKEWRIQQYKYEALENRK